jgi:methyl coenzyme M reductase subunit D
MKKGNLDMYIHVEFDNTKYHDYMNQVSEIAHEYLPHGWHLCGANYRKKEVLCGKAIKGV